MKKFSFLLLLLYFFLAFQAQTAQTPQAEQPETALTAQNAAPQQTRGQTPPPNAIMPAVPLQNALDRLNAVLFWDSFTRTGMLSSEGRNISFMLGPVSGNVLGSVQGPVLYDEREVLILPLPYNVDGNIFFPEAFLASVQRALEQSREEDSTSFRIAAIIVDPGHGGKDAGASGSHVINGKKVRAVEKEITLAVSKLLYEKLRKKYPDKRILITRTSDNYPTLADRVKQANSVPLKQNEAIIYISIHANASFNKSARGFEVWYLDPEHERSLIDKKESEDPPEITLIKNDMLQQEFNRESETMAAMIARRVEESFGDTLPSRGLKAEEWYVVRKARMPSILVELGFVTNKDDAAIMLDKGGLQKFSDSIYNGLMDFVTSFEASGGFIAHQ